MGRQARAGEGIFKITTLRAAANEGSAMNVGRMGALLGGSLVEPVVGSVVRRQVGRQVGHLGGRLGGTFVARAAVWTGGLVLMLGPMAGAFAARAIDAPPPTRAAVLNAPQVDAAVQADDRSSLRQGMVGSVSASGDAVLVNGAWFFIVEGRTQLFRDGRPAPAGALAKGQWLKFTLAPGTADRRTLGVVYVP